VDYRDHRHSFTERVVVNFSPAQLERLDKHLERTGHNRSGFIRRTVVKELDLRGYGEKPRSLEALVQETRGDIKTASR